MRLVSEAVLMSVTSYRHECGRYHCLVLNGHIQYRIQCLKMLLFMFNRVYLEKLS